MNNDDADDRTPNERKTGRVVKGSKNTDTFTVRQALGSVEAMRKYDNYLKEYRSRMRQLQRLARGEMAPSSQSYT
jgi:hypothetical protein